MAGHMPSDESIQNQSMEEMSQELESNFEAMGKANHLESQGTNASSCIHALFARPTSTDLKTSHSQEKAELMFVCLWQLVKISNVQSLNSRLAGSLSLTLVDLG